MYKIGIVKESYFGWLISFLLFFLSMPYFIWEKPFLYNIFLAFFLFFFLFFFKFEYNNKLFVNSLLILFYFIATFKIIWNNDGGFLGETFTVITFLPFIFIKEKLWARIFENFVKLYSLLIILPLAEYILIYFLKIHIPYVLIDPSPFNAHLCQYEKYNFLVVMQNGMHLFIPRFSGYFDEPGVVGTISMALLYTTKYNFKNIYSIPIFMAGILSFSLFFYLSTMVYVLFFTSRNVKMYVMFLIVILFILLWNVGILEEYVFARFDKFFGEAGLDERDNNVFMNVYSNMSFVELLFGCPGVKYVPFSTSYKYLFAVCGIIPTLCLMSSYFIKAFNLLGRSKDFLLYCVLFIFIIIQRPFINITLYIFLFTVPMYVLFQTKRNVEDNGKRCI